MVTHTQNLCSAFNPMKCTHTAVNTHIHCEHSPGAVGSHIAAAPGEQLGVRCLAQGSDLTRGIEGGREHWFIHSPNRQILPDLRLKPATFRLQVRLSG